MRLGHQVWLIHDITVPMFPDVVNNEVCPYSPTAWGRAKPWFAQRLVSPSLRWSQLAASVLYGIPWKPMCEIQNPTINSTSRRHRYHYSRHWPLSDLFWAPTAWNLRACVQNSKNQAQHGGLEKTKNHSFRETKIPRILGAKPKGNFAHQAHPP